MVAALRRLAARIDSEWKVAGYRPRDLPRVAARLLADARPDRSFDLAALADWTLSRQRFPEACNPFGPLGPPAFTVWSNAHLFVNVYVYNTPEVMVHDHDFAGAFVNLSGRTLHTTFDFGCAGRVDARVRTGKLRVAALEMIRAGDVRLIEPGSAFIHQVWHLDEPTVVLVVRTPPRTPALRQFQYLRPAIATQVLREDFRLVGVPERYRYTRKMAESLRASAKGLDYIRLLIKREQPWDAVWHLIENWRYLRSAGAVEDTVALGVKHQGAWFAGMADAGSELDLFYSIKWARVGKAEDRILLALLVTLRSWPPIRDTLAELLPEAEPGELIAESLVRLAAEGTIPLRLPPESRAMLWRFLLSGRDQDVVSRVPEGPLRQEMLLRPLFELA